MASTALSGLARPSRQNWPKSNLQYYIDPYPPGLPKEFIGTLIKSPIAAAFSQWQSASSFTFAFATSLDAADIVLGFYSGDHDDGANYIPGNQFGGGDDVLAHTRTLDTSGTKPFIHFHTGDALFKKNVILSVTLHEIGHLFGLYHSFNGKPIMYEAIDTQSPTTTLQNDDKAHFQSLYGPFAATLRTADNYNKYEGLIGFDLKDDRDLGFALDFYSTGQLTHMCFYRPGTGKIAIFDKGADETFGNVIWSSNNGIGGFNLVNSNDKAFALDYNSSGKMNHICFYRPGTGTFWILRHDYKEGSVLGPEVNNWTPVFAEGEPGRGIGTFNLVDPADRAFAFDYNSSGNRDHIALYRPGRGVFYIVGRDTSGNWIPKYATQSGVGNSQGLFDLKDPVDQAIAYDFNGNKTYDHILFWRAGKKIAYIIGRDSTANNNYRVKWASSSGIGGYDLFNNQDIILAMGSQQLLCYRPGGGAAFLLQQQGQSFNAVYAQGAGGWGLGGFDFSNSKDRAFALNMDNAGDRNHIVMYRPGKGALFITDKFAYPPAS